MSRRAHSPQPAPNGNRPNDFPRPAPGLNARPEYLSANGALSSNFPGTLPVRSASIKTSAACSAGTLQRRAEVSPRRKPPVASR